MTRDETVRWLERQPTRDGGPWLLLEMDKAIPQAARRDWAGWLQYPRLETLRERHGVWLPTVSWEEVGRDT